MVVNIQGDEPLIDPAAIDAAVLPLVDDAEVAMGTLKKRIEDPGEIDDPNVVKVVTDLARRRDLLLPLARSRSSADGGRPARTTSTSGCTSTGAIFCSATPACRWGRSRQAEKLEQLRALENGFRIRVVETEYESLGVDTPEDLERVARAVRSGSSAMRDAAEQMAKYIFVTGGVVSSLGKGIAAASIGCLLESRGLRVTLQKFDPYLNVDPGHHEPVPARRGLRHRRRRRDRPRPGPLRALHARPAHAGQQPHLRPHLRADHHRASGAATTWARPCR